MKTRILFFLILLLAYSCDNDDQENSQTDDRLSFIDDNNFSQLKDNVVIPAENDQLLSYSEQQLSFNASSTDLLNIEVGQIIVSDAIPNAPRGFLRKVINVQKHGNNIVLDTEQAKTTDAFSKVNIDVPATIDYAKFTPVELPNLSFTLNNSDNSFHVELVLSDEDDNYSTTDDQVVYRTTFRILNNQTSFVYSFGPGIEQRFSLGTDLQIEYINEIEITDNLTFSEEIIIGEIPLFAVLPGNVSASLNLEFKIGANGQLDSSFLVTNTNNIHLVSYIEFVDGEWKRLPEDGIGAVTFNSTTEVHSQTSLTLMPYITTGLELEFFDNEDAKAGIYLTPYLEYLTNYNLNQVPEFSWEYGYGIDLNAEARLSVLDNFIDIDYETTIWSQDYTRLYRFPEIPIVITNSIENVTSNSAFSGGEIFNEIEDDILNKGVCWSLSPEPTINDNRTEDGNGYDSYISTVTNLQPNTQYYLRAYAETNTAIYYDEADKIFNTLDNPQLPTLTTTSITNITDTSAISGGNITNDGGSSIIERGIVWSTSMNPTTNDNKVIDTQSTIGNFSSIIENLTPNTTYHVKAYAINSEGTAYGNEIIFTTLIVENIYNGDVLLTSQQEVDNFGSLGYTKITGYLSIGDVNQANVNNPILSNISNLSSLSSIQEVLTLYIVANGDSLINLDGLNISLVNGLHILNNTGITNIDGLTGITEIQGNFNISKNSNLTNINGLSNLVSTGVNIGITFNPLLQSLSPLSNITNASQIVIGSNASLQNLQGLNGLSEISSIRIQNNESLTSLDGINNLQEITSFIIIKNNNLLTTLDYLGNIILNNPNGPNIFRILENDSLVNLNGLSNVINISVFEVTDNTSLNDFCGFIVNNQTSGLNYSVSGNAYNPTLQDLINGNCNN